MFACSCPHSFTISPIARSEKQRSRIFILSSQQISGYRVVCVSHKLVGMELIPHDGETLYHTYSQHAAWDIRQDIVTRSSFRVVWLSYLPSQVIHVYLTAAVHPSLFLIHLRQPVSPRTSSALVACAFPRANAAMKLLIVMMGPTRIVVVCISFV